MTRVNRRQLSGALAGAILGGFTGATAFVAIATSLMYPATQPQSVGPIVLGAFLGVIGGALSGWVAAS